MFRTICFRNPLPRTRKSSSCSRRSANEEYTRRTLQYPNWSRSSDAANAVKSCSPSKSGANVTTLSSSKRIGDVMIDIPPVEQVDDFCAPGNPIVRMSLPLRNHEARTENSSALPWSGQNSGYHYVEEAGSYRPSQHYQREWDLESENAATCASACTPASVRPEPATETGRTFYLSRVTRFPAFPGWCRKTRLNLPSGDNPVPS